MEDLIDQIIDDDYIKNNHKRYYEFHGKGAWFFKMDDTLKISDIQPLFVPHQSIIMFVNDIRVYKMIDQCTEIHIPILVMIGRVVRCEVLSFP